MAEPKIILVPVDWDSPTWGENPVHIASFVDVTTEPAEDQ